MSKLGRKLFTFGIAAAAMFSGAAAFSMTINGAGASFPAPVYRIWTYSYKKQTRVTVNYQSVGSGAGIAQIKAKTVDFGASDKPLKKADLDKYGLMQFPMLMGGVVPIVNLSGVKPGELKLSADVLADIFLGKITKWNDPKITSINSGIRLPNQRITVVHRSDGSGTTWIFTNYLTKVSKAWASKVGNGKAVKWPVGIGGQKNPGVANNVKKISGSIGYVEYAYATEAKLSYVALQNKAGKFVQPTMETFSAAGANADWKNAPGFYMVLTDQPGAKSWPITGVTYILIYKNQKNAATGKALLKYFDWCYKEGDNFAKRLHYIPMPNNVVNLIKSNWKKDIKCNGKALCE